MLPLGLDAALPEIALVCVEQISGQNCSSQRWEDAVFDIEDDDESLRKRQERRKTVRVVPSLMQSKNPVDSGSGSQGKSSFLFLFYKVLDNVWIPPMLLSF